MMPRRNIRDGRMPMAGMRTQNTSPRFNNNAGSQAGPPAIPTGLSGAYNQGDTTQKIARNEYLNTLPTGGAREAAMNQMGYWNGGTPIKPGRMPTPGQGWMNKLGLQPGEQYQLMNPSNTGYQGVVTGGQNGATYSGLGMQGGMQRPMPTPGRPGQNQGGGRPGGGGQPPRRNPRGQNSPGGMPGGGNAGGQGAFANFPAPQKAPPGFLPMTPQFEAGRRGLEDQFLQQQQQLLNQRNLIDPQYQQALSRLQTNQGFDTEALNEGLANRGVYSGGGGTNPTGASAQLYNRDIQVPYGRQYSDLATGAAGQYAENNANMTGLNLGYNQSMAELLLNRAADAAQQMPMNVPQFSTGGRVLRGQKYNNKPQPNKKGRRNRGRK